MGVAEQPPSHSDARVLVERNYKDILGLDACSGKERRVTGSGGRRTKINRLTSSLRRAAFESRSCITAKTHDRCLQPKLAKCNMCKA